MDIVSSDSYFGTYDTRKFSDTFPSVSDFLAAYNDENLPFSGSMTTDYLNILYYLLYAKYGNSHWANYDENQCIFQVLSTIYIYGPTWAKRSEIQKKLRNLSEDELLKGSKSIYNHSFNPSTEPSTDTLEELTTINDQNTTTVKRSKLDAYETLWTLLKVDVTSSFIDRFKPLFLSIVEPQRPLLYEED